MWRGIDAWLHGALHPLRIASKPCSYFDASLTEASFICSSPRIANSLARSPFDNVINPALGLLIPAEKHCSFMIQTTALTWTYSTSPNSFKRFWWLDKKILTDYRLVRSPLTVALHAGHRCHKASIKSWSCYKGCGMSAGSITWPSWNLHTEVFQQCRDLVWLIAEDGQTLLKTVALSSMLTQGITSGQDWHAWWTCCSTWVL